MGGGASVPAITAPEVAARIRSLGEPYHPYADKIEADGVDGAMLQAIEEENLSTLFDDIGVTSSVHKMKLELVFKSFRSGDASPQGALMPAEAKDGGDLAAILKAYAAFLSHFKFECGTEARLVQQNLRPIIEQNPLAGSSNEIFLDSDDLSDLRNLLEYVKNTKVLVLLQSKRVLTRPWVILELHTALTNDVPIVALNVQKESCRYDYAEAMSFLMHFDEEIEVANPGAAELLIDMGVDPVDVAWRLSDSLPNIISTNFDPNSSEKVLQASLEDLVDSMRRATPIAPSTTKEEWLEKRKNYKSSNSATKAHGSSDDAGSAGGAASSTRKLAVVPKTVPELPNAYLVRAEDIAQLKEELLGKGGAGSTALTSKGGAKKSKSNKVGAHGMGGVGKTTIAAALLQDREVRSSFDKIVWVSLGQEPDIREMQDSMHIQLTGTSLPETIKSDGEGIVALCDAAANLNCLLVLDDVWDAGHEKALNCINPDNASRVLVTTRIRGLLKNSAEVDVGVLSSKEALELLMCSADMDVADVEEGSDELRIAQEVVELCGKLPLTLAIAGGMISDNPDGFTDDVVELMKEDRLREQEDEDEMTLEERVIASSLKMIKGKNKDLVLSIFKFFAVFPEDVPVPAGFFNVFASMLTGEKKEKKAKMTVGNCLGILLKYNLIKGALASGQGVLMHDIVRDYVINQHSEEELRAQQRTVVNTILAARPETGFQSSQFVAASSFEGYVARSGFHHMRMALEEGEAPPDEWLGHKDFAIKANAAMAYTRGEVDPLIALSEEREAAGELVRAAYASAATYYIKGISSALRNDQLFRAQDLLARADDKNALEFEQGVLNYITVSEPGTERYLKAMERGKNLGSGEVQTASSLLMEGMGYYGQGFTELGFNTPVSDNETLQKGWVNMSKCVDCWVRAGHLPDCPDGMGLFCRNLEGPFMYGFMMMSSTNFEDPEVCPLFYTGTEELTVEAIKLWDRDVNGLAMKNMMHMDHFLTGMYLPPLGLAWGNFDAIKNAHEKVMDTFRQLDLAKSRDYASNIPMELVCGAWSYRPLLLALEMFDEAESYFTTLGFSWSEETFKDHATVIETAKTFMTGIDTSAEAVSFKMQLFLSSSKGKIDESLVNDWIPAPLALAKMNKDYMIFNRALLADVVSYGARAFLKLGRDDDAYEVSRLALTPEYKPEKSTSWVFCRCVLGQVAAKRGDLEEADGHFADALEDAKLYDRMPMLEVIVARDWKRYLLEPNGRDCSAAEAAIDAACSKMKKTREQISRIL